ncbi:MAG: hypothetical protein AAF944_27270 [Bacteroidota bacterium]
MTFNQSLSLGLDSSSVCLKYLFISCFFWFSCISYSVQAQSDTTQVPTEGQPSVEPIDPNGSRPHTQVAPQPGDPTQAPDANVFSLQGDQVGLFQNGVNLFTGEVAFNLPLVSLPNRNGLNGSLSLSYNSAGTKQMVETWNLEAPTSAVGLGWSLNIPKIVVDHKQTGTNVDDDYYLVEGGVSTQLMQTGKSGSGSSEKRTYQMANFRAWKITYFPDPERWEIIKEDGNTYTYGGAEKATQYLVRWGNWIGNSNRSSGQTLMAMQWDLSKISNRFRDEVTFTYWKQNRRVGSSSGKEHTEASYLKEIKTSLGYRAVLDYRTKSNGYQEPNTEKSEPDAYQERYEQKLYSQVTVYSPGNQLMYRVHLSNTSGQGAGDFYKPHLRSIQQENALGEKFPSLSFSYHTSSTNPRRGSISKVTTPSGAIVEYTYNTSGISLSKARRDLVINAPSGYAEPQTWIGDDYVVVAWRQLSSGNHSSGSRTVKLEVYSWVGRWVEQFRQTIGNVKLENNRYKNFSVATGKDFFAVLHTPDGSTKNNLYLSYKNAGSPGQWHMDNKSYTKDLKPARLLSGERFVAVANLVDGDIRALTWNGDNWYERKISQSSGDYFFGSGPNYIICNDNDNSPDKLYLHYLNEQNSWIKRTLPSSISFNSGNNSGGATYWYGGPSFAVAMVDENPEYIYRWDKNFNFSRHSLGGWNDQSPVFITGGSMVSIAPLGQNAQSYRFDGQNWRSSGSISVYNNSPFSNSSSYGEDFVIARNRSNEGIIKEYNPNSATWGNKRNLSFSSFKDVESAGINYAFLNNRHYYRNTNGSWQEVATTGNYSGWNAAHFTAGGYRLSAVTSGSNTYVRNVQNGKVKVLDALNGQKITRGLNESVHSGQLIGSDIVITYPSSYADLEDAKSLILRKLVDNKLAGSVKSYPVTRITVKDGYQSNYTSYGYTTGSATLATNGVTAQFNRVRVVGGSSSASTRPFGSTEHFFFNNLPFSQLEGGVPNISGSRVTTHYGYLTGVPYLVKTYNNSNTQVAEQKSYWKVLDQDIAYFNRRAKAFYARVVQRQNSQDGVKATQLTTYNSRGQLETQTVQNHNSKGQLEQHQTVYTYGHQAYSAMSQANLLSPVVQTKQQVKTGSGGWTTTDVSATTWKDWGSGRWNPLQSYAWTGSGSNSFSFTSSNSTTSWRTLSKVIARNDKGQIIEYQDIDGMRHVTVWGHNKSLPILQVSNAGQGQVLADNFDDGSLTDDEPVNWYRSTSSITINEYRHLQLPLGGNTTGVDKGLGTQDFIADFSLRLSSSSSSSKWAGFNFAKKSVSHRHTNSGYTLMVRWDGKVVLHASSGGTLANSYTLPSGDRSKWHQYRVVKQGSRIQVYVDGTLHYNVTHSLPSDKQGNYVGFSNDQAGAEVDNFRVYPHDGFATMTSYDPLYRRTIATYGDGGEESRLLYDANGQLVTSVGLDSRILSSQVSYQYQKFNSGTYSNTDPNSAHQSIPLWNDRYIEDFERFRPDHPTYSFAKAWSVHRGALRHYNTGSSASGHTISWGKEFTAQVVVELDVKTPEINSTKQTFGFTIGGSSLSRGTSGSEIAAQTVFKSHNEWQYYQGGSWKRIVGSLKPHTTYRFKVVLNTGTQKADYYVDGHLFRSQVPFKQSASGIQKLSFYNLGGGNLAIWRVDNIVVYTNPIQQTTYLDATGKVRQTQAHESDTQVLTNPSCYLQIYVLD